MLDGRSCRHAPGSSVAVAPRLQLSGWRLNVCWHRLAVHCYAMARIVLSSFFSCSYPTSWVSWVLRQCGMLFAHRRMISYFCCVRRNAFWLHLYLFFQAIKHLCSTEPDREGTCHIVLLSFFAPQYCCAWCSSSCDNTVPFCTAKPLGVCPGACGMNAAMGWCLFFWLTRSVNNLTPRFHTCKWGSPRAQRPASSDRLAFGVPRLSADG